MAAVPVGTEAVALAGSVSRCKLIEFGSSLTSNLYIYLAINHKALKYVKWAEAAARGGNVSRQLWWICKGQGVDSLSDLFQECVKGQRGEVYTRQTL